LLTLSEEDRARVVQLVLATFPELDRDGMTDLEREKLDAELKEVRGTIKELKGKKIGVASMASGGVPVAASSAVAHPNDPSHQYASQRLQTVNKVQSTTLLDVTLNRIPGRSVPVLAASRYHRRAGACVPDGPSPIIRDTP